MRTGEKSRWGEIVGAAVINGLTCAILGFVLGYILLSRVCPAFLILVPFVTPFLLMKWPIELQSWVFGEYPRESETILKIAAVIGGYVGLFALIFIVFFGALLYIIFTFNGR